MLTAHNPPDAFPPVGLYSHGMEVPAGARLLFVSGTMGMELDHGLPPDADGQCALAWRNIKATLASAGMAVTDLVKVNAYLSDAAHRDANARQRALALGDHRPAVTTIVTGLLESAWLVEIDAVAAQMPSTSRME